jgi:hypothetical protein
MSLYAFFYTKQGRNPCGDRSVIRLDARLNHWDQHEVAGRHCKARGFHAYVILRGPLRDIPQEQIDNPTTLNYPVFPAPRNRGGF